MRRLVGFGFVFLLTTSAAAQTATPTITATPTLTPTPTVTPITSGAENLLATLDVTAVQQKWITLAPHPQIEITNIGPSPAYIKLSTAVVAAGLTPTPVPDQYTLKAGATLLLSKDISAFYYIAVTSNTTTLSVVVRQ
jgi:hypothetical protein